MRYSVCQWNSAAAVAVLANVSESGALSYTESSWESCFVTSKPGIFSDV